MRNYRMAVSVAAVCLMLCGAVQAQEKVTLKMNLPANKAWKTAVDTDMNMNMTLKQGDQEQTIEQKMKMVLNSTMTPLEVADGTPTKMKVAYAADCKITMTMMGQTKDVPFPLAGKTLTVTKKADGSVDVDPAEGVDAQTMSSLKNAMDSAKAFYPDHPVGAGDTWDVKSDAMAKMFQMADAKGTLTCTLDKLAEQGGRKVAMVSMKGSISGTASGVHMDLDLSGPLVIDVATGQALDSTIKGDMKIKNEQPAMTGTGTIGVKQTNALAD